MTDLKITLRKLGVALTTEGEKAIDAHIESLEQKVERLEGTIKDLLMHFTPEHLNSVSNSDIGTRCAQALLTNKGDG